MVEQMNRDLITHYTKEYRKIFEILLDRSSYPTVIHCSTGKGRTGIVSALILAALDVDEDVIMDDYRLSNEYFNIPSASKYAYQLPARSQEAITTAFSARENYLNAAKEEAEKKYGDLDTYLRKGIGLSKEEIKRLQSILLEKSN
jgi:protein-tyrosine phosphatase